jgi:hypothetical protein
MDDGDIDNNHFNFINTYVLLRISCVCNFEQPNMDAASSWNFGIFANTVKKICFHKKNAVLDRCVVRG